MAYLYLWDSRDGAADNGWWFGPKPYGSRVYAKNPSTGIIPPESGWEVPRPEMVPLELSLTFENTAAHNSNKGKEGRTKYSTDETPELIFI